MLAREPRNVEFMSPEQANDPEWLLKNVGELAIGYTVLIGNSQGNIRGSARFVSRREYGKGRTRTRNGVHFADVILSDPSGNTDYSEQPVAIKPFDDDDAAVKDFMTSNEINIAAGEAMTFTPIGFVRQNNDRLGMVTKYERGVTTFDNILHKAEMPSAREIEWALSHAAETLFFLHANDWIHGDFQVQNTAYDSGLSPRIVDITDTRKVTLYDEEDISDFRYDLKRYLRSLNQPYLDEENPYANIVSTEQAMEYFIKPYARLAIDTPHLKDAIRKFEDREYTAQRVEPPVASGVGGGEDPQP